MSGLRRVCIVGSGPSGFYAAKYLLRSVSSVHVHLLDRSVTPFGLVRNGVAPDHPEVKAVQNDFAEVAKAHRERFRFFGNVEVGRDVSIQELRSSYDATICAYGAGDDAKMGIPGEESKGVLSARAFVNWYNGHPDFGWIGDQVDEALGRCSKAIIVGNGNVALDCARILCKDREELRGSDISQRAEDVLSKYQPLEEVFVLGRRGAVQAAFTIKELREQTRLQHSACVVDSDDLTRSMTEASKEEITAKRPRQRLTQLIEDISTGKAKDMTLPQSVSSRCHLRFLMQPAEVLLENGRTKGLRVIRTALQGPPHAQKAVPLESSEDIEAGLVLRSIGYRSQPLPGIPFDNQKGVALHEGGRCEPGLYVAGWLKRGPRGIIGTNISDAKETVDKVLEDAESGLIGGSGDSAHSQSLPQALETKSVVSWDAWLKVNEAEEARGAPKGKPREKITDLQELLEAAGVSRQ